MNSKIREQLSQQDFDDLRDQLDALAHSFVTQRLRSAGIEVKDDDVLESIVQLKVVDLLRSAHDNFDIVPLAKDVEHKNLLETADEAEMVARKNLHRAQEQLQFVKRLKKNTQEKLIKQAQKQEDVMRREIKAACNGK